MRLAITIFIASAAIAQQPVASGPDHPTSIGAAKHFNWFTGTGSGCTAGANGFCTGASLSADAYFFTAWLPNASGLPKTSGLPIVGTVNDSANCGNVGIMQLDVFDWTNPNAAHMQQVNCIPSYNTGTESAPGLWQTQVTSGGPAFGDGSWKTRVPFSRGGLLYLPISRQIHAGTSQIHDSSYAVSPDSGAHWCNPYTLFNVGTSPGTCNSSKWQADGDAPICGAAGGGSQPCTDASYTDATHSNMMWHQVNSPGSSWQGGGTDTGAENWSIVQFGTQDGQPFPTGAGAESGCDPAAFNCFMLLPGDGSVARVPVASSILDITAWRYYTCPTITQNFRCDPTDSANWTATFANRTSVILLSYSQQPRLNGPLFNPYAVMYFKEFGQYVMTGEQADFWQAPALQGPWTPVARYWGQFPNASSFFALAPALGYTVVGTSPPHIQMTTVSNNYLTAGGTPEFALWDFVLGKQMQGETPQQNNIGQGDNFVFSAGNVAGSFPRKDLVWSFDLTDAFDFASGERSWPSFLDRGNYSASITPCLSDYGASPSCGTVHNASGTALIGINTGIQVNYIDTSTTAHFQVVPAAWLKNSTTAMTPASMQGNGSFSAIGVYSMSTPLTPFGRYGSIWVTGTNGGDNAQSQVSLDAFPSGGKQQLQLNYGANGTKHWQFVANQTLDLDTPYFVALTVQAQTSCGTGCVPAVHLWVGISGVLTDLFAGQSYTAVSGASTSAKTPAVVNGPFVFGINSSGAASQVTANYYTQMVYGRPISFNEIQQAYKSMTAKMTARGVAIGPPPPALTFTPSPTQIAVSYTAPSGSACTVEASESSSYSPLVHDVDTVLFAGSDQDNRTDGGISDGTRRVFVLGKRLWDTALDAKIYSRALQAYTPYFFRITCGATVMTGSATTANIPLNSTYQDIPQLDRSTPGNTVMPAYPTSRSDSWNWPTTGAKVVPVSLTADIPYDPRNTNTSGPFLWSEGARRVCGASLVGPGPGYLCQLQQGDGGPEYYVYIIPSTGERRYLGVQGGLGAFNSIDGKFYGGNGTNITVQEYNGTYASGSISFTSPSVLISNILTAMVAFDATFDPTLFPGCGGEAIGDNIHLECSRNGQDSYAWAGDFKISTTSVVAATRFDDNIRTRWCAAHHILAAGYDLAMFEIIPHQFVGGNSGPALGQGPYLTTLTANINSSQTTIAVAGEPGCVICGADAGVPPARVGDVFQLPSGEFVQIGTKFSSTSWGVVRGARSSTPASQSSGGTVLASCDQTVIMWKFAADPHGTDTTNTNFVQDFVWQSVGGHDDATTDQLLSESGNGWVTRVGNLITEVGQPYTALIPAQFNFAGKSANCDGNACRKHPASGAPGSNFFGDFPDFDFVGTANGAPTLANVTGTLYKVTSSMPAINPKHYAIAAVVGAEYTNPTVKSVLDVSGPGVTIGGSSGDNYKMVIANVAGEGFSGSSAGDIYVNIPGGSIIVPSTTQTSGETHSGTAVSGGTTLTLYSVSGGCMGCNTTYYWSSYTGPFPTTSMSFTVTGFADPNNNVTATPTSIQPSTCDNSTNLCIANFSRYANGAAQIGTDGTSGRILASLPLRNTNDYPTFKVLADGSYMLYAIGSAATAEHWDAPSNVVMVKLPPFTAPDIKDRSTFLRAALPTVTPPAGTVTAAVEFGYVEQGTVAQHYCTSRREACVVVSSTVTDATPYWFESTDFTASRYTRIPCTVSCTATLPVLPSHTGFYQWVFYDSGGAPITTTGYNGVAVEDLVR